MASKSAVEAVPASVFARKFGRYRVEVQRHAVAVTSHGSIAGYFIAPDDYEEYERMKAERQSFATDELDEKTIQAVAKSRMHSRHRKLNAMPKRV